MLKRLEFYCFMLLFVVIVIFSMTKNIYHIHASNGTHDISVIDTLRLSVNRKNGDAQISTLGSSVTQGSGASSYRTTWVKQLANYLRKEVKYITYSSNGYGGFSTSDILSKVDVVINQKPDVVLFETCIMNDFDRNIPIRVTISNIDEVVQKLQKGLPNATIIIQSPNPIATTDKNIVGLNYQDYIEATKAHIISKGWEYVDIFSGFNKQRSRDGLELRDVLADGFHPNDIGYSYWFNTLKDYFATDHI